MTSLLMKDIIHIAVCFDHNYHQYSGVLMYSICINTPGPIHFHALVAEDVTQKDRREISDMIESFSNQIHWYVMDEGILSSFKIPEETYLSDSTFNRLFLPKYLPEDIKKVIYLDSDMISLGSLQPLWETELAEDEPVAMTIDYISKYIHPQSGIGLPGTKTYYNAGMLLMNLACWREEDLCQACVDVLCRRALPYADQDALNLVLGDRIKAVHLKYNLQKTFQAYPEEYWMQSLNRFETEIREALSSPVLIHYTCREKPWHEGYYPGNEWQLYKKKSPWRSCPPVKYGVREDYHLVVQNKGLINTNDMNAVVPAFIRISQHLSNHHRWLFVPLRKTLCTIAKHIKTED